MEKFTLKEIIGWPCLLIFLFISFQLEYDSIKFKTFLYPVFWVTIAYIFTKKFRRKSILRTVIYILGGIMYSFIALGIVTDLIGFCSWGHSNILYSSKIDKSIKIDCRSYECFMTSDDCNLYKVKSITAHLKWVTEFDENPIDTSKWEKVSFTFNESNKQ